MEGLRRGRLKFRLEGEKLQGNWNLVRMKGKGADKNWLLIKERDDQAASENVEEAKPASVKSGRTIEEISQHCTAKFPPKP